jgi:hypothetical protein
MEDVGQDSRHPCQDSNRVPSEYHSEILPLEGTWLEIVNLRSVVLNIYVELLDDDTEEPG